MASEAEHLNQIISAYCDFQHCRDRTQRYNDANRAMNGGLGPYSPPPVEQQQEIFRQIKLAIRDLRPDICLQCGRSPCACKSPVRGESSTGGAR